MHTHIELHADLSSLGTPPTCSQELQCSYRTSDTSTTSSLKTTMSFHPSLTNREPTTCQPSSQNARHNNQPTYAHPFFSPLFSLSSFNNNYHNFCNSVHFPLSHTYFTTYESPRVPLSSHQPSITKISPLPSHPLTTLT